MTDSEIHKEYLRDAFMAGALDLGADQKFLEGFIRIFAGEMEALIAVDHASYLEPDERRKLLTLAQPTQKSFDHLRAWKDRIHRAT